MAESKQKEISIQGVEASSMEALINFAYSGKVSISTNNVQSLMMGASFLQLARVRDACAEFLMARLSPVNVMEVQNFADSLGCTSLVVACQKYAQKFFPHVVDCEEFLGLSTRQVIPSHANTMHAIVSTIDNRHYRLNDNLIRVACFIGPFLCLSTGA